MIVHLTIRSLTLHRLFRRVLCKGRRLLPWFLLLLIFLLFFGDLYVFVLRLIACTHVFPLSIGALPLAFVPSAMIVHLTIRSLALCRLFKSVFWKGRRLLGSNV